MIESIQINKLRLVCDVCGKEENFKDKSYIGETFADKDYFGERGNYEYAKKEKGWMIRNHTCKCNNCKGKKITAKTGKSEKVEQ